MAESAVADFMSVRAAAELLGVTSRTVYVLVDEGELRAEITWPTVRGVGG